MTRPKFDDLVPVETIPDDAVVPDDLDVEDTERRELTREEEEALQAKMVEDQLRAEIVVVADKPDRKIKTLGGIPAPPSPTGTAVDENLTISAARPDAITITASEVETIFGPAQVVPEIDTLPGEASL